MELNDLKKKILIITSGQPSLNPRLVKEADALTQAGCQVIVLYAYWNDWGTQHDKQLLSEKKWNAICLGGDPDQKRVAWFLSRLIYKVSRYILQKIGAYNYLADIAIARSSYFLIKETRKHKADLYIAHNLGALPAAVKAAKKFNTKCGFDAEDFHRQEVNDDINSFHFKITKYIEDKYLPLVNYLTVSSPLIAEKYSLLYKRPLTTILNVFPKIVNTSIINNTNKPLKLFWFSQTIGPNRGLETIIEAIALTKLDIEFHILGQFATGYQQQILQMAQNLNVAHERILFYSPVSGDQIFNLAAQFDIGLASETGFCLNRNMALSNKLFTYIQSGLAVVSSNTQAQHEFMQQYPKIGKTYSNAHQLSIVLKDYFENKELLLNTKKTSFEIGQTKLNWENESKTFLNVIKNTLISMSVN